MGKGIRVYTMLNLTILVAPLAAFVIGLGAVWTVRRIALAVGFVDHPDRWRKLHEAPIALGGGLAVWLATWSGWSASLLCGAWKASSSELGLVLCSPRDRDTRDSGRGRI